MDFDGFKAALVERSLDGGPDEQIGSACEAPFMWAGLFRFTGADSRDLHPDCEGLAGAVLLCAADGTYRAETYASRANLDARWGQWVAALDLGDGSDDGA